MSLAGASPQIAVFPFHDPAGEHFAHLAAALPGLESIFTATLVGVSPASEAILPELMVSLRSHPTIQAIPLPHSPVGGQFAALYRHAARTLPAEAILHLCFHDRLAYILQTSHARAFRDDIQRLTPVETPLLYHRSQPAWDTHPRNYTEIEQFITRVGSHLLGRELDFAWCHLAISAARLKSILPAMQAPDLSMLAEMILALLDDVQVREVDWLAWEDPFLISADPDELRVQRESSPAETLKRLGYALPMIEKIIHHSKNNPG